MKLLIILNMGAPKNLDEVKVFLTNMFRDPFILRMNIVFRYILAFLITFFRSSNTKECYKLIGSKSPLKQHTEDLVSKLNKSLENYEVIYAMRYTPPFIKQVLPQLDKYSKVTLLPLYPQYSTTTTLSSLTSCAFIKHPNIRKIQRFYKNQVFNNAIINNIKEKVKNSDAKDMNLIFSAHSLPQNIIKSGDPYEKEIKDHIQILTTLLNENNISFKSISLAYQSKLGPIKWLEPSLGDALQNFKNQNVLIYPISFVLDNLETDYELKIEYKDISKEYGVKSYDVVDCLNSSDLLVDAICDIIKDD